MILYSLLVWLVACGGDGSRGGDGGVAISGSGVAIAVVVMMVVLLLVAVVWRCLTLSMILTQRYSVTLIDGLVRGGGDGGDGRWCVCRGLHIW